MTDNLLKKEFTKKDVTRLRNLFTGKFGDSTLDQVGYTPKQIDRKEGDIWEEGSTKWTIKNGIKQTYTQLDGIKKMFATPMVCPECKTRMKDKLDKRMYQIHGKCLSCVQTFETKLKLEGKYQEYANKIMYANARTMVMEAKEYIEHLSQESANYYTESGKKERWTGPAINNAFIEKIKEEVSELENRIEENQKD